MNEMVWMVTPALSLVYLAFVFWLRSDLIKIRRVGVKTAPNLTALIFLIVFPFVSNLLGELVGRPIYYRYVYGYGSYSNFYQTSGVVMCLLLAALAYYFYRLSLVKKIHPDNPPLAPLPGKNGIVFWVVAVIYVIYFLIFYLLKIYLFKIIF